MSWDEIRQASGGTSELLSLVETADLPDGQISKPCGNRRTAVCPSCAETYRRDAYQLIRAGLIGGKGVPASVAGHPAVFATFVARRSASCTPAAPPRRASRSRARPGRLAAAIEHAAAATSFTTDGHPVKPEGWSIGWATKDAASTPTSAREGHRRRRDHRRHGRRRDIRAHLDDVVADDDDALVFTGVTGAVLRRSNFQRTSRWTGPVAAVGLPGFHFHDLRHTGNTLASRTGASLADFVARMGHASTRAAMIYQHTAQERDEHIADGLSAQIKQGRDRARNGHAKRKNRST